ncbi:MAG: (E)-4-hydroxy-3-methylbut-2-enyl-diphosphate synthase [Bacteroidales bacterium]|nr:(E)-4-hydroxy-3-methylbut-2-enyl-diphosphate synthase [Bacteroidales bacterium]MCF8403664.1 (E)-4-hydroxy-3-methylbut-2-enyl-diphosphate synthase [Bacteroidales bacterium]
MIFKDYKSKVVQVGNLSIGGNYPVRIQSMTTTNTMDTLATIEQSVRLFDAGCELVRITAPGVKEAENLRIIKKELLNRGYTGPLIADIHYQPKAAEIAAHYVEKVRINPGNYVDRKKGKLSYSDSEYQAELQKISDKLKPLLGICKEHGTALRIGTNHGSLSERILMAYGDTPEGMVESALEFVKICEAHSFYNLVLSLKSSNVKVMMYANRLLIGRMNELGISYPIHLGVTEAGDAEDGRIKSAAGIGPLLLDGIGDTIRVSLTEEPEFEIPVAKNIVISCNPRGLSTDSAPLHIAIPDNETFNFVKRKSKAVDKIGGGHVPVVILNASFLYDEISPDFFPDYFITTNLDILDNKGNNLPPGQINLVNIQSLEDFHAWNDKLSGQSDLLVFELQESTNLLTIRNWFAYLRKNHHKNPVILKASLQCKTTEELIIKASSIFAYFLVDGEGDGIWIESEGSTANHLSQTSFGILQAIGARISKTEYIACPSCGRTLFNIQQTLQEIKSKTSHLKGLKIGVMGCCVNGPGEMADADYGYVGAGKGKINLYKGKMIVKAAINEAVAVEELISVIKANNDWQ